MNANEKNFLAVGSALKAIVVRCESQQIRIDGLVATVSTLTERVALLEVSLLRARAASAGHGPSVRT